MLSIVIPTHNYAVFNLIKAVHRQLCVLKIPYEIVCLEDGSNENAIKANVSIEKFENTKHLISKTNKGRIKSRQTLCEQAKFDWILFMDADTMPVKDGFIQLYYNSISDDVDAIFGGIAYEMKKPEKEYLLRWKYGKLKEITKAIQRNKAPYKYIVSANMLIRKQVFSKINSEMETSGYGLDNYFGMKLKENDIKILHIDNEVFHLGIEKSDAYLEKKEQAAKTLLNLIQQGKITAHDNQLLSLFITLKKYKLHYFGAFLYKIFGSTVRRNLIGKNPSIKLLQFYRIGFMCQQSLNG